MKNKKNINEDYLIEKETFSESFAKMLSENPKKLKLFKKHIAKEFNKTKDTAILLRNLKTLVMAEGKAAKLAKHAKISRTTVYKMLSDGANPSFKAILSFVSDLGIHLRFAA
ncbi:MAG: hypothetical protein FWG57_04405 [Endomicrobia bacterium]|nr:hypothetical protein [Endomicrobiia bacterium]